jgi:Zn-dependent protease
VTDGVTDGNWFTAFYQASTWVLPLLVAIPFHEAAHGFAAHRLGDDTAWNLGRVSFNPLKHVDPFGTIILPFVLFITGSPFLFGYAKPVPVNFQGLRDPRLGSVLVAAAGPGINIVLAFVSAFLVHAALLFPQGAALWLAQNLAHSIIINVTLAAFNMLPLPPLDGGRVAVGLLPRPLALPLARIEPIGIPLLLLLLVVLPAVGSRLNVDLDVVAWVLGWPVDVMLNLIASVTGVPEQLFTLD